MKATRCLPALAVVVAVCAGCAAWKAPVVPPPGGIYTHYSAPLTLNDSPAPVCQKHGQSGTRYIAYPFAPPLSIAWADAALQAAAKDGGITKIHYADYEVLNVLGVYMEFTVRAYGE